MKATKRGKKPEPWDRAQFTFYTVREYADELRALAKREGMTVNALMAEAIYKHMFRLEQKRDPELRRKSVCLSCGKKMDAATDGTGGTGRARPGGKRQKPCSTVT